MHLNPKKGEASSASTRRNSCDIIASMVTYLSYKYKAGFLDHMRYETVRAGQVKVFCSCLRQIPTQADFSTTSSIDLALKPKQIYLTRKSSPTGLLMFGNFSLIHCHLSPSLN